MHISAGSSSTMCFLPDWRIFRGVFAPASITSKRVNSAPASGACAGRAVRAVGSIGGRVQRDA